MHADTVELLIAKAHVDPSMAVAFAESIDMAIAHAQLVTVPILDARLAKIDARFVEMEAKVDARFVAMEAKFDARFDQLLTQVDARISKSAAETSRWVLLTMLGSVALNMAAMTILHILRYGL